MTGAELGMMVVLGFCVAIAINYLIDALPIEPIGFDADSLWRTGLMFGGIVFALIGPVLVVREMWEKQNAGVRLLGLPVALVWAAALGIVVNSLVPVPL